MSSLLASAGPSVLKRVSADLAEACEERLWAQSDSEIADRVAAALRVRAQADAVLLAAVGEVDARGLARARGCTSTRAWLRSAHRIAPHKAKRLVRTATALGTELPTVSAALGSGAVSLAQAEVIVAAIADLPRETPVACRPQAEATMIEHAASFDPMILARIGGRLAEIIDPDGVQARDEQPILDREADAHRDRTLTLSPDTKGAGGVLRARLDAEGYATLAALTMGGRQRPQMTARLHLASKHPPGKSATWPGASSGFGSGLLAPDVAGLAMGFHWFGAS